MQGTQDQHESSDHLDDAVQHHYLRPASGGPAMRCSMQPPGHLQPPCIGSVRHYRSGQHTNQALQGNAGTMRNSSDCAYTRPARTLATQQWEVHCMWLTAGSAGSLHHAYMHAASAWLCLCQAGIRQQCANVIGTGRALCSAHAGLPADG